MLVLTRNVGDRIVIAGAAGSIVVEVRRIAGRKVRIALDAPRDMQISRVDVARQERSVRRVQQLACAQG